MAKYRYLVDAYVGVVLEIPDGENPQQLRWVAKAKDEAREIEVDVDFRTNGELYLFDAYGIEDAETGEEIRPVG